MNTSIFKTNFLFAFLAPLREIKIISTVIFILFSSYVMAGGIDELPDTKMKFSPFKDTIVAGFEIEIQVNSPYEFSKLSITSTNCSIMLKDAEKGIYMVKAPMTSSGKKSSIKISRKNANGSFIDIYQKEIPIVAMTTEMRKRYTNYLMKKK